MRSEANEAKVDHVHNACPNPSCERQPLHFTLGILQSRNSFSPISTYAKTRRQVYPSMAPLLSTELPGRLFALA
ncbi:MAG: hypothetical protein DWQ35_15920 [Planctomycetota bacterium]|nr:MAG: hypothetical protein DWQ35_15920 [Planctomycetota bacterium]REK18281.1 MAG: hypothetical protein DWQ42_20595 [Planctomycetota bacterium]REK49151.1 MAG: hypothetical protein DWQ46_01195 [Planctomycetota bacterium]